MPALKSTDPRKKVAVDLLRRAAQDAHPDHTPGRVTSVKLNTETKTVSGTVFAQGGESRGGLTPTGRRARSYTCLGTITTPWVTPEERAEAAGEEAAKAILARNDAEIVDALGEDRSLASPQESPQGEPSGAEDREPAEEPTEPPSGSQAGESPISVDRLSHQEGVVLDVLASSDEGRPASGGMTPAEIAQASGLWTKAPARNAGLVLEFLLEESLAVVKGRKGRVQRWSLTRDGVRLAQAWANKERAEEELISLRPADPEGETPLASRDVAGSCHGCIHLRSTEHQDWSCPLRTAALFEAHGGPSRTKRCESWVVKLITSERGLLAVLGTELEDAFPLSELARREEWLTVQTIWGVISPPQDSASDVTDLLLRFQDLGLAAVTVKDRRKAWKLTDLGWLLHGKLAEEIRAEDAQLREETAAKRGAKGAKVVRPPAGGWTPLPGERVRDGRGKAGTVIVHMDSGQTQVHWDGEDVAGGFTRRPLFPLFSEEAKADPVEIAREDGRRRGRLEVLQEMASLLSALEGIRAKVDQDLEALQDLRQDAEER